MTKYILLVLLTSFQVFAANEKVPADKAVGYYDCSGTKNGVAHYGMLDIYLDEETGKTVLEYSEQEVLVTYDYSKASFYKVDEETYRLNLARIKFTCTPFGNKN